MSKDLRYVKLPWQITKKSDTCLYIRRLSEDSSTTEITVKVHDCLGYDIECYGIKLPEVHSIYKSNLRSLQRDRLHWLLSAVDKLKICEGIVEEHLQKYAQLPTSIENTKGVSFYLHAYPLTNDAECFADDDSGDEAPHDHFPLYFKTCVRSVNCSVLTDGGNACSHCIATGKVLKQRSQREKQSEQKALSLKAPLKIAAREKLVKAIKTARETEKLLRKEVESLKEQIKHNGVTLDKEMHNDLRETVEKTITGMKDDSFEKLFWKQQVESFKSSSCNSFKWHPMMIRFALHLHLRSPSAYNALRQSKVVKLPCERTLRDYTNVISPNAGFGKDVFDDLKKEASKLHGDIQSYVTLMFDEVSIKDDLVFDNSTGELIGFINLGQNMNEFIDGFKKGELSKSIASHALVFMVVGLASNLKQTIGFFGTRGATADVLYPLVWKAVGYLETYVGLKVISVVSDKASPNQRFYRIHKRAEDTFIYRANNIFAKDEQRHLYFFSDAPHLLKTIRNNLANSGAGLKTRYLWNKDKDMLWSHVVQCYQKDCAMQVRRLPKISRDHIYLTSFSKMRVNLAAQVMSETVSKVMQSYCSNVASETAHFIGLVDKFFDCFNSRSLTEAEYKRKPFLAPFKDANDARFEFLENEFLKYLKDWKAATASRKGSFSKLERSKMFLSEQTYEGIQTSVYSLIESTKFLLDHGFQYVLTNKFNQDPLEEHFGRHRALARRSTNPTLHTLGYQENKLRIQRSIATLITPKGNVRGRKRKHEGITITNSPLKRRRKLLKN